MGVTSPTPEFLPRGRDVSRNTGLGMGVATLVTVAKGREATRAVLGDVCFMPVVSFQQQEEQLYKATTLEGREKFP